MAASDKELITALRQTISRQEKMLNQQTQTIQDLRETVTNLHSIIANLEETLAELRRKIFGTSSEKTPGIPDKTEETVTPGEEKRPK